MQHKRRKWFLLGISLLTPLYADNLPTPSAPTTLTAPTQLPSPDSQPPVLATPTTEYASIPVDTVQGHRSRRLSEQDADAAYPYPYIPPLQLGVPVLPSPANLPPIARHMTLNEAIALALRNNPLVKNAELNRIENKFGLETAIFTQYMPQWQPIVFTNTMQSGQGSPTWNAGTGVSITGMEGTQASITYANTLQGGAGATTLSVTQPLLQNFGRAYNSVTYFDALTTEAINKLTFKNSVINVVVTVITNYRALVQAYENLALSKQSVQSQQESVNQTEIQVKIGKMAPSDLLQQQEQLQQTKVSVVQDIFSLRQAYQNFLSSLGIVPSANVIIDQDIHISRKKAEVPSEEKCIQIALKYNISYQQALLSMQNDARGVITAKNAKRWQLNLTGATTFANGGQAASAQNPSIETTLSVPLNNVPQQSAYVTAKVTLEEDKLNLEQDKENLVRQVDVDWQNIQNEYEQIVIAKSAVELQLKTLNNAQLKLRYGKSSVFEINTLQAELLNQQVSLEGDKIAYLNAITTLNQLLGITLDERHVKLRY